MAKFFKWLHVLQQGLFFIKSSFMSAYQVNILGYQLVSWNDSAHKANRPKLLWACHTVFNKCEVPLDFVSLGALEHYFNKVCLPDCVCFPLLTHNLSFFLLTRLLQSSASSPQLSWYNLSNSTRPCLLTLRLLHANSEAYLHNYTMSTVGLALD